MYFDYNIPIISLSLFAIALLGILYISFLYAYRLRVVRKHKAICTSLAETDSEIENPARVYPKASVVVYTRNDAESLSENLPIILQQEYPGRFEVIVVNDGVANEADTVVTRLKQLYPNLYLTFAPDSSRNVSRKKLAITLGIKAAKGEVIVVTDAYTRIPSPHWLERMVHHFNDPQTEVVIGYSKLAIPDDHCSGRLTTAFDSVADAVTWLSAAIQGNPYRGSGNNIAYRKDLFFKSKGFSNSLVLRDGDDDIFVNEIANPDNTQVELSPNAICSTDHGYAFRKVYRDFRLSHAFTGRNLPKASRRMMAIGEWSIWIIIACALVGAFFAGPLNIFGWILAALMIIYTYIFIVVIWRKTIADLHGMSLCATLPFMAAFRPWRNVKVNLRCTNRNNPNFTWQ